MELQLLAGKLTPGRSYRAAWIDPRSGDRHDLGQWMADDDGARELPLQPEMTDWLLLIRGV